jgi:small subunit ribosomal protein S20
LCQNYPRSQIVPIKKSSKKDVRRTARRRKRNVAVVSTLRSTIKKVREAKSAAEAAQAYGAAESLIDKAARRRYIHPKAAARIKSRLSLAIKKKSAAA